jgi:predicted ribonuclease YlaK
MEQNEVYTGYKIIKDSDKNLPLLYEKPNINTFDLLENQYLVVVDDENNEVDCQKWQDGKHKKVISKNLESAAIGKIKPLNFQQKLAIDMLLDGTTTVKVLAGKFGSGKDLLMASAAFMQLQADKIDKICWCRNNVEVRDTIPLGALPGSIFEKIGWCAGPLIDILGGTDALHMYMNDGKIEIQHLGHIRGRDIRGTALICSEAENLSKDHVQLLLGRVAAGSTLYMNGDSRQKDMKIFETNNGLQLAIDRLKGNRLFGYVYMPISVRSETAKLADLLD